jgi:hypothetical protein
MLSTLAIPRPGADEHLPYYEKYIAQVPGDDAMPTLVSHIEGLHPVMRSLSDTQALHRYAPGKWSVKEVIGHLIDGERVFTYRALRFARADATPLAGFDENAWVPHSGADRRPIADLADELRAGRTAPLAMFPSFDAEMLVRRGEANGATVTPRALAWICAGHAIHHHTLLRERYGLGG